MPVLPKAIHRRLINPQVDQFVILLAHLAQSVCPKEDSTNDGTCSGKSR
jgi:hypothetical protein